MLNGSRQSTDHRHATPFGNHTPDHLADLELSVLLCGGAQLRRWRNARYGLESPLSGGGLRFADGRVSHRALRLLTGQLGRPKKTTHGVLDVWGAEEGDHILAA